MLSYLELAIYIQSAASCGDVCEEHAIWGVVHRIIFVSGATSAHLDLLLGVSEIYAKATFNRVVGNEPEVLGYIGTCRSSPRPA